MLDTKTPSTYNKLTMAKVVSVSAQIPVELSDMLDEVARTEERSKSYYIKKGLEIFLGQRLQTGQLVLLDIIQYEN